MTQKAVSASALLDLKYAGEILRTDSDKRHMLRLVASTLGDQIAQIATLLEAGDAKAAYAIVHQIKGFLPVFCASSLAKELADFAQVSRSGDLQEVKLHFAQIRPLLEKFDEEVRFWLGDSDG